MRHSLRYTHVSLASLHPCVTYSPLSNPHSPSSSSFPLLPLLPSPPRKPPLYEQGSTMRFLNSPPAATSDGDENRRKFGVSSEHVSAVDLRDSVEALRRAWVALATNFGLGHKRSMNALQDLVRCYKVQRLHDLAAEVAAAPKQHLLTLMQAEAEADELELADEFVLRVETMGLGHPLTDRATEQL